MSEYKAPPIVGYGRRRLPAQILGTLGPSIFGIWAATAGFLISAAHAATTYYVNTTGDPGIPETLSLRQAVALAGLDSEIQFDASLLGSTITLTQGAIAVDGDATIKGFIGPRTVTISGGDADRIFTVSNATLNLSFVALTAGHSGSCGGAIYVKNGSLSASGITISGSSAASGGAVCAIGSDVPASITLDKSRISGNSAGDGGGIYAGNIASLGIIRTTISKNSARRGGGGIYAAGVENLIIRYSLISGNSVPAPSQYFYTSEGGGMVAAGLKHFLVGQTTFSGNYAYGTGAAIRFQDAYSANVTTLTNVTVVGNSTAGSGAVSASAGTLDLKNTILANNTGGDLLGTFVANYSLIKNPIGGQISGDHNLIGADPQLGALADHGGSTFTMLPLSGSPVIDAGTKNSCTPGDPCVDQRGFPAFVDPDIGAVELQNPEEIVFRNDFESH